VTTAYQNIGTSCSVNTSRKVIAVSDVKMLKIRSSIRRGPNTGIASNGLIL
jgi:hypothetical protein